MKTRFKHFSYFGIAGGASFSLNVGVLHFCVSYLVWNPYAAQIPAAFIALIASWLINRTLTFTVKKKISAKEFLRYLLSMCAASIVNYAIYSGCLFLFAFFRQAPVLALVPATLVSMIVSYSGMKFFAFKAYQ